MLLKIIPSTYSHTGSFNSISFACCDTVDFVGIPGCKHTHHFSNAQGTGSRKRELYYLR